MRNIARKTTSLALVLVLLLSTMSVAAFASNEVQPCAMCKHPQLTTTVLLEARPYTVDTHWVEVTLVHYCPDCGFGYQEEGVDYTESHNWVDGRCDECGTGT